jgi:hypothetical protein
MERSCFRCNAGTPECISRQPVTWFDPWRLALAFIFHSPAISTLATWVYNSTGKRLFAAWLFHATLNASNGVFPLFPNAANRNQSGFLILCGLLWVWALGIIAIFGSQKLSKPRNGIK